MSHIEPRGGIAYPQQNGMDIVTWANQLRPDQNQQGAIGRIASIPSYKTDLSALQSLAVCRLRVPTSLPMVSFTDDPMSRSVAKDVTLPPAPASIRATLRDIETVQIFGNRHGYRFDIRGLLDGASTAVLSRERGLVRLGCGQEYQVPGDARNDPDIRLNLARAAVSAHKNTYLERRQYMDKIAALFGQRFNGNEIDLARIAFYPKF